MKWNESGFRPPLCTYRLNWARRTSWGWWDDWDDTVLQTQDSIRRFEHATSRSRRLPTILTFTRGWGRNNCVSFKPPRPGTEPRTLAWKAAVLTTTLGPPPWMWSSWARPVLPRASLASPARWHMVHSIHVSRHTVHWVQAQVEFGRVYFPGPNRVGARAHFMRWAQPILRLSRRACARANDGLATDEKSVPFCEISTVYRGWSRF